MYENVLSSAQAQEELNKLEAKRNDLNATIETRKKEFDSATIEKRDEILDEIKRTKDNIAEIEKNMEELTVRMATLKDQEQRAKASMLIPSVRKDEKMEDTVEYRDAYINYLKTNNDSELRALTTSTGNVPVPTVMQEYIESAWERSGHIAALCRKTNIRGIVAVPVESEAGDAGYHAEGTAAPAEEEITFVQVLLQPVMIKKWISWTDELAAMAGDEFLRYIADEVVNKVVSFLDHQIIAGEGSTGKGVIGIVKSSLTASVEAKLSFNAVNEALATLGDSAVNPTVVMNRKTFFSNYLGLVDTAGRPIFTIASDNSGKPLYLASGVPVVFSSALKDYDSAAEQTDAYMIVGDFSGYRLNYPEGETVRILRDQYSKATEDKELLVGRLFVAGAVTKPEMFAKVSKPAAE